MIPDLLTTEYELCLQQIRKEKIIERRKRMALILILGAIVCLCIPVRMALPYSHTQFIDYNKDPIYFMIVALVAVIIASRKVIFFF